MRQMWDAGQISGAYQVSTSTGMFLVQDFLPQLEEAAASERLRQQQAAQAQAEAEQRRMEHTRLEAERARQQQVEQDRIKQEQKERQSLSDASSGKKYHLYLEGQKKGPFNKEAVQVMVNAGKATPETLVWTEDLKDWMALSGYPELLGRGSVAAPPPYFASVKTHGQSRPSGNTMPMPIGASNQGNPANQVQFPITYAGFWKRFCAVFIDGIIVWIIQFVVAIVIGIFIGLTAPEILRDEILLMLLVQLSSLFVNWLYFAGMESSSPQATLGKLALGIKVTDLNGRPISFGKATGRYLGKFISSIILGIGFLMAGWTEKKQALHDMMADCLVVNK
jgi:uncharacterized RDD family membrane protein YckC